MKEPLNELMALFTPPRWAYKDLEFESEIGSDGVPMMDMKDVSNVSANLRWNSAELNLFTVAIFLLCAQRVRNPLQMLILDDPLQNMDELTVTTLARGLSKVLKLWPSEWRMIVLMHAEGDLERMRRELPSAVYYLPWLSPAEYEREALTTAHDKLKDTNALKVQELKSIAEPRA